MSELQPDDQVQEDIEPIVEDQEIESDLATDNEPEHEQQPEVDEEAAKKEATQKAINKKHFEAQQAKRDLEAANKQIEEFKAKEREQMAAKVGNIPPPPDPFDDDYEAKVKERDSALIAQANWNTQNQSFQQQQEHQRQQAELVKQQERETLGKDFLSNAKKVGATDEEFNGVVNSLNTSGMSIDLGSAIMSDPDGYLIAKHLAANPVEAYEINNMNPVSAGTKLAEIKQKAVALRPKQTKAPKPSADLSGNGVDPEAGKYKYLDGATFE